VDEQPEPIKPTANNNADTINNFLFNFIPPVLCFLLYYFDDILQRIEYPCKFSEHLQKSNMIL